MLDFMMVSTRPKPGKRSCTEIYPVFKICKSRDLMIRGQDFYAIWLEEEGRWSTDEQDAVDLIDKELDKWAQEHADELEPPWKVAYMSVAKTGIIDDWHRYVMKQSRDNFKPLNENLVFAGQKPKKTDYASISLPYALAEGDTEAWDKLFGTLYSPEELHKLEWSIGSIVTGASKTLQKFVVLYGTQGSGKGTFLKVLSEVLFPGYSKSFKSQSLGQASNAFPLQDLKDNPLVAFDMDGKLNKIEDNTTINTLVSHEKMSVNLKGKQAYEQAFKSFLFVGSNEPVKITNAKSGLLRRLIDVTPTGTRVSMSDYNRLMKQIKFEAGAICWKCKQVFEADPEYYQNYIPEDMMSATNDFYQFVVDQSIVFEKEDGTTLRSAWNAYKEFCDYAKIQYPFSMRAFREELKNYFKFFEERHTMEDGTRIRCWYSGFIKDKFENKKEKRKSKPITDDSWLIFKEQPSLFDMEFADSPAQYAEFKDDGKDKPKWSWSGVKTKLGDLDTKQLHYVKPSDIHLITVDFDIPVDGKKNFEANKKAVLESGLPKTYAELSKSGEGIHLQYYYDGNPDELSSTLDEHIEIKVQKGGSSLRRKLTKCNDIPIAHISGGLPLKEVKKKVTTTDIHDARHVRNLVVKALKRQLQDGDPEANHTKTNVDFIDHVVREAYDSKIVYDISDLYPTLIAFASHSTNNSRACMRMVDKMPLKYPDDPQDAVRSDEDYLAVGDIPIGKRPRAFFDVEVFPNLFMLCWKEEGPDKPVNVMLNPKAIDVENFVLSHGLIGFNNRRYDNHIVYAWMQGYNNDQLYKLSKAIVSDKKCNHLFGSAYDLSLTDIYDFSSKKQSLKKFEIELAEDGVPHKELGFDWDQPVPEDQWNIVADYCKNDVLATEAVFNARQSDFVAREILADIAGMSVNSTTNSLTTRIIFGSNRNPQSEFNYRNLAEPVRP